MSKDKAPREFWIDNSKEKGDFFLYNVIRGVNNYNFEGAIHVIDYASYDALKAEVERLKLDLENMNDVYYDIVEMFNAGGTEDVRMNIKAYLDESKNEAQALADALRAVNDFCKFDKRRRKEYDLQYIVAIEERARAALDRWDKFNNNNKGEVK